MLFFLPVTRRELVDTLVSRVCPEKYSYARQILHIYQRYKLLDMFLAFLRLAAIIVEIRRNASKLAGKRDAD